MEKIKNLAYLGIACTFVVLIGMLIAFLGFISIFAQGMSGGASSRPDFSVFNVGFSIAFISGIIGGMVRLVLQAMIISKGFQVGRGGIIAFFADIIKEANKKE